MIEKPPVTCDKTNVGAIVRNKEGHFLMVLRDTYPFGYAPPFGHCDGRGYPVACLDQIFEETGLDILRTAPEPLIVKNPRNNKCWRGGNYHQWQVFEFNQTKKSGMVLSGSLSPQPGLTRWVGWVTREEIHHWACMTDRYLKALELVSYIEDSHLKNELIEVVEKRWSESPGLEVEWFRLFQELRII